MTAKPIRSDTRPPTTWTPVDLAAVADVTEEATILTRVDNIGLIYRGRIHWFQGPSESHKTWVLLIAASQQLLAGGNVAFIDFEDHPSSIRDRLTALGVPDTVVNSPERFAYIRPDEPLGKIQLFELEAALNTLKPTVVIVDGVTEAMSIEGLNPDNGADTARWINTLLKPITRTASQPAVAVIDHQKKYSEGQKGWATGSQHKKAGVDGAAYDVSVVNPVYKAFGIDEVEGTIRLTVSKDRPGYVRGHATSGQAATIRITAWPDEGVTFQVTTDAIAADHGLRTRIAKFLHGNPGASKTELRSLGKAEHIDDAIREMTVDGHITVEKEGQKHAHRLTDEGETTYIEDVQP